MVIAHMVLHIAPSISKPDNNCTKRFACASALPSLIVFTELTLPLLLLFVSAMLLSSFLPLHLSESMKAKVSLMTAMALG